MRVTTLPFHTPKDNFLGIAFWITWILFFVNAGCAQVPANRPYIDNPAFDAKVSQTISFTVPLISVAELKEELDSVYLFDARKKEEFEVSHIPGANYLGYKDFDAARLESIPKDAKLVLYCSIGYRSEKIGEKLQKLGFTNVQNLYGSIFEWVNEGNKVVDKNGKPTNRVHTYNKAWSKWVDERKAEKVW
jgi:rhodanese-related sulfurtransferase